MYINFVHIALGESGFCLIREVILRRVFLTKSRFLKFFGGAGKLSLFHNRYANNDTISSNCSGWLSANYSGEYVASAYWTLRKTFYLLY